MRDVDRSLLAQARSFLFVPGDRPDRFGKAHASGADVVVLDLEDAVAPRAKAGAREAVAAHLGEGTPGPVVVRVSEVGTAAGDADLTMLAGLRMPVAVMVAKTGSAGALEQVALALDERSVLLPLIETAVGVLNAASVAAHRSVVRLVLGHLDLGVDLGLDPDDAQALAPARFALVAASAAAGIAAPVDGVCRELTDAEAMRNAAVASLRAGFPAKLCIHPAQVPALHEALRPDAEELRRARAIVATAAEGASAVDGAMIDRPVLRRAEIIIARGER